MNTMQLVEIPAKMSVPRHGGIRLKRRKKLYINGFLYKEFTEGQSRDPIVYSSGRHFDRALKIYIGELERVLLCKCELIDASVPIGTVLDTPVQECKHEWIATRDWAVDKCEKCGTERRS